MHGCPTELDKLAQDLEKQKIQKTNKGCGLHWASHSCVRVSFCHPVCSAVMPSWLTASSASWVQVILLPQPPKELEPQAGYRTWIKQEHSECRADAHLSDLGSVENGQGCEQQRNGDFPIGQFLNSGMQNLAHKWQRLNCEMIFSSSSTKTFRFKQFSCLSLPRSCHYTQLIFVFLVKMGFQHVGQSGLELLTSSNLPALASQSAGITAMSHSTRPLH
ncbi:hypothetical protein AAY473_009202 [Plecturocebus cupreus]